MTHIIGFANLRTLAGYEESDLTFRLENIVIALRFSLIPLCCPGDPAARDETVLSAESVGSYTSNLNDTPICVLSHRQ